MQALRESSILSSSTKYYLRVAQSGQSTRFGSERPEGISKVQILPRRPLYEVKITLEIEKECCQSLALKTTTKNAAFFTSNFTFLMYGA